MRNFLLGETKELGIKMSGADGVAFKILEARYEYKNHLGEILASGEAIVEDKAIYTNLTPTELGFNQVCTFIVKVQSDNKEKGIEQVRQDITVNVVEEN